MLAKHLINKILITLEVGDKTSLFILLTKEGLVTRKGDGNSAHDLPLATGISKAGHFDAMLMTVNEDLFNYIGVVRMPQIKGIESRLSIIFQGANETDYSFRVIYGSESEGPPYELAEILINAVKLTDGWYAEQQNDIKQAATVKNESKWWHVWKA